MESDELGTKQLIIKKSLDMFSVKGFDAVSVQEIADAVGIKPPSLYKHFKSKQDIFNAILEQVKTSFEQRTKSLQIDGVNANNDKDIFSNIGTQKIVDLCIDMFLFYVHDDNTKKCRKMLTIEQYKNRELGIEYVRQYIDFPLHYQSSLFDLMIKFGASKGTNPNLMAVQYYSPVHFYIAMCDIYPEREPEAVKMLRKHFDHFMQVYSNQYSKGEIK